MIPLTIVLPLMGMAVQMLTNKRVVARAKVLVANINNKDLPGLVKTDLVLTELKSFFGDITPIFLELVIKVVVLSLKSSLGEFDGNNTPSKKKS